MIQSKIEDIEVFIAVVESGGFSSASDRLTMQVARVSRAIQRLETNLNTTLLNRTTRRVELTEEGKLFYQEAKHIVAAMLSAEESLKLAGHRPSGKLRVDAASPFILHQIVPLVDQFLTLYPDIQLQLISSENMIDLLERRTDIAIRIGQLADSNLHATFLGESKLKIVATPKYLALNGQPTGVHDLVHHQIVGFADAPTLNEWPLLNPVTLPIYIAASSGESVRQLVLQHQGIALLSNFMIQQDLANGQLVEILPQAIMSPNPREKVHAVYYKQATLSERIRVFIDFLKSHLHL